MLLGWRTSTIDVDLVVRPEDESLHRAIPAIKERLQINVEFASPLDFIPVRVKWPPDSSCGALSPLGRHELVAPREAAARDRRRREHDLIANVARLARGDRHSDVLDVLRRRLA